MSTMEEAMLDLVAEQLGLDRTAVTLDSTLESLGVDSLDSVDLILATESKYNIHIPDEELPKLDTPRKMIAFVEAQAEAG